MTINWCDLETWDDDTLRFVADRNNPERGDVVVVCTTSLDSSRKMARAILDALGVAVGSNAAFDGTQSCWAQARLRWRIWQPQRLTLVGAHRLHLDALEAVRSFATEVECDLNLVTAGHISSALAAGLAVGTTPLAPGALLDQISHTPAGPWRAAPHPGDLRGPVADAFDAARRRAVQLLERLEPSAFTWFEPLGIPQMEALAVIVDETPCQDDLRQASAVGVVAGAAIQGWRWPKQASFIGQHAHQPGQEDWGRLDRYREPGHAAAVALAALGLLPGEALALGPGDVAADGSTVLRAWGPEAVTAPPARRSLAALSGQRPPGQAGRKYLSSYGRPFDLSKLTDVVRRSVGVLGADIVT